MDLSKLPIFFLLCISLECLCALGDVDLCVSCAKSRNIWCRPTTTCLDYVSASKGCPGYGNKVISARKCRELPTMSSRRPVGLNPRRSRQASGPRKMPQITPEPDTTDYSTESIVDLSTLYRAAERERMFDWADPSVGDWAMCQYIVQAVTPIGGCRTIKMKTQSWLVMPIIRDAAERANNIYGATIPSSAGRFHWDPISAEQRQGLERLEDYIDIVDILARHLARLSGQNGLNVREGWDFDNSNHLKAKSQETLLKNAGIFTAVDRMHAKIASCCMHLGQA